MSVVVNRLTPSLATATSPAPAGSVAVGTSDQAWPT